MIRSITATNPNGDSLILELSYPEKSGYIVKSVEGLGPVKASINTSDIVTFDGAIYNSARASNRNIVLNIGFLGIDIEGKRHELYRYFPLKQKVKILIQTDDRLAETSGYVETHEPDIFSKEEGAQISILCPDAYCRDASEYGLYTTEFYGIDPSFEFPFENNSLNEPLLEFGNIKNSFEENVIYSGEVETGFVMTIHALDTVDSDIVIIDYDTLGQIVISAERIKKLTGSYLRASDDVTINTIKGYKKATLLRGGKTTNILSCLNRDAEWFQLTNGNNKFGYRTSSMGTIKVGFSISTQNMYLGV